MKKKELTIDDIKEGLDSFCATYPFQYYIKDKKDTKKTIKCCSRCKGIIDNCWENDWPNYGKIHLGAGSNILLSLTGADYLSADTHQEMIKYMPDVITKSEAQEVVFEWGSGYKYDSSERYRLCMNCQEKLLRIIGKFFKCKNKWKINTTHQK